MQQEFIRITDVDLTEQVETFLTKYGQTICAMNGLTDLTEEEGAL